MNQQLVPYPTTKPRPQEQMQAYAVQALWIQTLISVLMAVGVVCFGVGSALKTVTEVIKK